MKETRHGRFAVAIGTMCCPVCIPDKSYGRATEIGADSTRNSNTYLSFCLACTYIVMLLTYVQYFTSPTILHAATRIETLSTSVTTVQFSRY